MPQCATTQVIDCLLAAALQRWVDRTMPRPDGVGIAVVPHTQPLDIAHGISLSIEKMLDDFSKGGVAQSDVERCYDSLPLVRVMRWLEDRGMPHALAASCVRAQLLPQIDLVVSTGGAPAVSRLGHRTGGTLTGSRVAGIAGRIPIEASICSVSSRLRPLAWPADAEANRLTIAVYVDNLFAVGRRPSRPCALLKKNCAPLGGCGSNPAVAKHSRHAARKNGWTGRSRWPLKPTLKVLGHVASFDGAWRPCWSATKREMWGAFWANARASTGAKVPPAARLSLLNRTVRPRFDYRCSRWPWCPQLAAEVDRVQRRLVALCLRLRPAPGETREAYARRRGRAAQTQVRKDGLWSKRHAGRVLAWAQHLQRPQNASTWAARAATHKDPQWLVDRRAEQGSTSHRTRIARRRPGRVHARWQESLAAARDHLET